MKPSQTADNAFLEYCARATRPEPYVFLETRRGEEAQRRALFFSHPVDVISFCRGDDVEQFLLAIDEALSRGLWVAGYFAYEFGYLLEPTLSARLDARSPDGPLAWLGLFRAPVTRGARRAAGDPLAEGMHPTAADPLGALQGSAATSLGRYQIGDLAVSLTREQYGRAMDRVRAYILDGDTYQVNFTFKYRFKLNGKPEALYLDLRERQAVAYSGCLFDGRQHTVSLSPELFLRRQGNELWVKPMKGTVRRGRDTTEDARLRAWLQKDAKNRAENVMVVDMIRNDVGRIAAPGGVRVEGLFDVEQYETLFQMTSSIGARVSADTRWRDIFRALFPCASVTGAPKIRTMELISELENEPRGVYTGAIGYISPQNEACFNVAIRTLVVDRDGHGEMGIGSGIVYDSDVQGEYEECLLKADFLVRRRDAFSLIETMRIENGAIYLLAAHLHRLEASAAYFGFVCPREKIEAALLARMSRNDPVRRGVEARPDGRFKLRLLLHRDGEFETACEAMPAEARNAPLRFKISSQRTNSGDVFLYHKTTHRPLYRGELRGAREGGHDEVVFLNERGEITEACQSNIFLEMGGILYTPPLSSGLLPGTLRARLIEDGRCQERLLCAADLARADAIYLGNSVRGLVESVRNIASETL